MINKHIRKLILVLALGLFSPYGQALELGLTPSHVCGLWANINQSVLRLAKTYSTDPAWLEDLQTMSAQTFSGKKPVDVLARVVSVRNKLNRLSKHNGLKPAESVEVAEGEKITPSTVFLNSGYVLDNAVMLVIKHALQDELIAGYYAQRDISGKTPSDAYGFVDLAERRIDKILAQVGA